MSIIKKFFAKEKNRFYDLLCRQTAKTLEGLGALADYLDDCGLNCVRLVKKFETEADDLRVRLIEELDKTFVTPIDREDIFDLSRAIDDIMDYANSTVLEMEAFEVKSDEHIKLMVNILIEAGNSINEAISLLDKDPKVAQRLANKAKACENQMEEAYRQALSRLFKGTDPVLMFKKREVYRHLSNAGDRADEAADILSHIIMKHS
jgi:uncharacterized protein Yka (UPF0111/DUF47 family)